MQPCLALKGLYMCWDNSGQNDHGVKILQAENFSMLLKPSHVESAGTPTGPNGAHAEMFP